VTTLVFITALVCFAWGIVLMREFHFFRKVNELFNYNDFKLELVYEYNKDAWGYYFPHNKRVQLYILDENNELLCDEILVRESLHEITHHIHRWHRPGKWNLICAHNGVFRKIYYDLLLRYYEGKIPVKTAKWLKEMNYIPQYVESGFNKRMPRNHQFFKVRE
jgi:hypothetical protein